MSASERVPSTAALPPDFQPPPDWAAWRKLLAERGFHASRRWGQNFLIDPNMLRALVADAALEPGGFVLEIGAGLGTLSRELAASGARLLAVEIDARLAPIARAMLAPFPRAELLEADALAGKHELHPELSARLPAEGSWQVVANLPYSAASPLLVLLARRTCPPSSFSVLVQLEVAERIAAKPGESAWGALSARLQSLYQPRLLRKLAPQLFWPRPEIDSALLRLELLPAARSPSADEWCAFDSLVDAVFQARRKSLRAALSQVLGPGADVEGWLRRGGLDPLQRGEGLTVEQLVALSQSPEWRARGSG